MPPEAGLHPASRRTSALTRNQKAVDLHCALLWLTPGFTVSGCASCIRVPARRARPCLRTPSPRDLQSPMREGLQSNPAIMLRVTLYCFTNSSQ